MRGSGSCRVLLPAFRLAPSPCPSILVRSSLLSERWKHYSSQNSLLRRSHRHHSTDGATHEVADRSQPLKPGERIVIQYPSHESFNDPGNNGPSCKRPRPSHTRYLVKPSASRNFVPLVVNEEEGLTEKTSFLDLVETHLLRHFLPAQYPHSVGAGYRDYALAAALASVAGSASMVLGTQAILVGVVGDTAAPVAAGALNWILKDGIGQVGGVLFASHLGSSTNATSSLDAQPKKWRVVAALALDAASLLELAAVPLVMACATTTESSSSSVLLLAATAGVLKNIGFLTASASKAALHQALAVSHNLADVTAKAGSQTMAASLVGTALGVGLAMTVSAQQQLLQQEQAYLYLYATFGALILLHQVATLVSVRAVVFSHFNKQRLDIVLVEFLETGVVLSPAQVASREVILSGMFQDKKDHSEGTDWDMSIGSALEIICPKGPHELSHLLDEEQKYLLNVVEKDHDELRAAKKNRHIHLIFFEGATGEDLIRGNLHAWLVGFRRDSPLASQESSILFPELISSLKKSGWHTSTELTQVEPHGAFRLAVED